MLPPTPPGLLPTVGMVGAGAAFIGGTLVGRAAWHRRWPALWMVALFAVGIGLWRAVDTRLAAPGPWVDAPRTPIRARIVVESEPDLRWSTATFRARIERISAPEGMSPPPGKLQVVVPALTMVQPGERFEIAGRVAPTEPGSPFSGWLAQQGVVATMAFPELRYIGQADLAPPSAFLWALRERMLTAFDRALPQPHAALVSGLVLGNIASLPEDFRAALVASGTSHLVVVSGYNVTLVGAALAHLTYGRRRLAMLLPILGVWSFTILVGALPPAVRAAIMFTSVIVARGTGRGSDQLSALALAATGLCLAEPALIVGLGFQVSFLSTLGLIGLADRFATPLRRLPRLLRESLASTVAASVLVAPLLTVTFHQTSLVAALSNLLVAPLVPMLSILGALSAGVMALFPGTSAVVGAALVLPAHVMVSAIRVCATLPFATVTVGDPVPIIAGATGAILVGVAAASTPEGRDLRAWIRSSLALPMVIAGVVGVASVWLIAYVVAPHQPDPLLVSVLDVGHGDAILVRSPNGRTVLIDGGPNPAAIRDQLGRRLGLFDRAIDASILTRVDDRRLPGAVAATERYPAAQRFAPTGGSPLGLYSRWSLGSSALTTVDTPTEIQLEPGLTVDIWPTAPVPGPGRSDSTPRPALLLRIIHGQVAIVIGPSIAADAALKLVQAGASLRADVLVVPRHGDANALSASLMRAIDPTIAVLSVGARNVDNLPTASTLDLLRDITLHRTDLHGTIELRSDGVNIQVSRERDGPNR